GRDRGGAGRPAGTHPGHGDPRSLWPGYFWHQQPRPGGGPRPAGKPTPHPQVSLSHGPGAGQVHRDPGLARRHRPHPPLLPLVGQRLSVRSLRHSRPDFYRGVQFAPRTGDPAMTAADGKLRLAFVSPLPPLRSGIAEYSARLLPHLAAHYDITVVVHEQQVSDPWVRQHCRIRDDHWFLEHGGDFDRVLYHFGNSPYHLYMFDLLARWPGVVVLHDFYLGQAVERLNSSRPGLLNLSLYRGWGYSALLALRDRGVGHAVWHYPLNYEVLSGARGVVVHSPYSKVLADQAYGKGCRV